MGVLSNSAIIVLLVCIGGNGIEAKGVVGGWQEAPDLPIYRQLCEVTDQALPSIKRQLGMLDIEVLNFKNAKQQDNNWKITIDTNGTNGQSSEIDTITFTVEQLPPKDCPHDKNVCVDKVEVDTPPNDGAEQNDVVDGFKPVTNFERFQAVYQATRLAILDMEGRYKIQDIKLLTFRKASLQIVEGGTNWKIKAKVESQSIRSKHPDILPNYHLSVNFEFFQPDDCQPSAGVCVEDLKKVTFSYYGF